MASDLLSIALSGAKAARIALDVTAQNIANADTPGYRARAIGPFAESVASGAGSALRATRPGHMQAQGSAGSARAELTNEEPSPNGNTVSLETEMLNGVEVAREHSQALAIYKHALGIIRSSLGR